MLRASWNHITKTYEGQVRFGNQYDHVPHFEGEVACFPCCGFSAEISQPSPLNDSQTRGHMYLSVEEVILAVARYWRRRRSHGGPEEKLQAGDGAQEEVVRRQLQKNQNKS